MLIKISLLLAEGISAVNIVISNKLKVLLKIVFNSSLLIVSSFIEVEELSFSKEGSDVCVEEEVISSVETLVLVSLFSDVITVEVASDVFTLSLLLLELEVFVLQANNRVDNNVTSI